MKTPFLYALIILFGINAYAQKHRPVGFVPFEAKIPNKNPFLEPKTEQEKKEHEELEKLFQFTPFRDAKNSKSKIDALRNFETNIQVYSDFGKAQYYYRLAEFYLLIKDFYEYKIYNFRGLNEAKHLYDTIRGGHDSTLVSLPGRYNGLDYNEVVDGALEIIALYTTAASYSSKNGKRYIDFMIVEYARRSEILKFFEDRANHHSLTNRNFEKLRIDQIPDFVKALIIDDQTEQFKEVLMPINQSYQETKFNGDEAYFTLTPSANFKYDREGFWIGGEFAFDFNAIRNPYKIDKITPTSRVSLMHVGMNHLLDESKTREFYFGFLRINSNGGLYFKFIQFGFIQNLDDSNRNAWFYRPQIGFAFGHFQLYYSYTAVFNKELRELAPKHAINLRFAMPYFRVSRYDRSF